MDRSYRTYGEKEKCIGFWWGNLRENYYLEDLCIDGRKILKQIFNKECDEGVDRIYLTQDEDMWPGFCERGDESSIFIKCVEFID